MATPGAGNLTTVNALIFDGVSPDLSAGSLRVAAGVIAEIGDVRPSGEIIDAAGDTVIPGLIDAHFHAYAAGLDPLDIEASGLSYLALAGARRLAAALSRASPRSAMWPAATRALPGRSGRSSSSPPVPVHRPGAEPDRRSRRPPPR